MEESKVTNLSQIKRRKMLETLKKIKQNISDEETLNNLSLIENELNEKKYGLIWEEHEERVDKELKTQIPVFENIVDKEIIANEKMKYDFLLEGDNLHSLYLLEKTHKNSIDVIYIDPPYNTGNKDFIYNDKIVDGEDSFRHSKWLSFMSRRLTLAKELLKDDGVIFVSINDIENAQLKLLMDEIFDETNFIGQLVWESTTQPTNAGSARFQLQKKTEPIYCFAKNKLARNGFLLKRIIPQLSYPHTGKFGACRFEIIEKSDSGAYRRDSMKYKILGQEPRPGKRWQIGEETARKLEAEGKLEIVNGIVKRAVYPEDEDDKSSYVPFWSLLLAEQVKTAQTGKDELNKILDKAVGFDTVKPTALIKELLSHFDKNITVLDFFAGSGTTAQAVMELNKEDGGNRQFILCTNNENNICEEITYERIKTVITGNRQDGSKYSDGLNANLKYYKTSYVPRVDTEEDNLHNNLLANIKNLIQLENGINIDDKSIKVFLDEEEFDKMTANKDALDECNKVYISSDILMTSEQEKILENNNIDVFAIPEYYFKDEIVEVTE